MVIYLDYVFFINFLFDLILLFGVSIVLKRNTKIFRIIIGALAGSFFSIIVFLPVSSFIFFILKIITEILMLIITFNYKDIKYTLYNTIYLSVLSIIVGGTLYLIDINLGFDHNGFLFFTNGKSINTCILIIISLIIIIIYKKLLLSHKMDFYTIYKVKLYLDEKVISLNGYLDTGNTLKDPYFNKPIFILNNHFKINKPFFLVPYETINNNAIMKCYKIEKIFIENIGTFTNCLVGISGKKITISGIDIILNSSILEDK